MVRGMYAAIGTHHDFVRALELGEELPSLVGRVPCDSSPYSDLAVHTACCDELAVVAKGGGRYRVRVAGKLYDLLSVLDVPEIAEIVFAARRGDGQPRMDRYGEYGFCVGSERLDGVVDHDDVVLFAV